MTALHALPPESEVDAPTLIIGIHLAALECAEHEQQRAALREEVVAALEETEREKAALRECANVALQQRDEAREDARRAKAALHALTGGTEVGHG